LGEPERKTTDRSIPALRVAFTIPKRSDFPSFWESVLPFTKTTRPRAFVLLDEERLDFPPNILEDPEPKLTLTTFFFVDATRQTTILEQLGTQPTFSYSVYCGGTVASG
jgi:hypothetical protein